jgi:hypothetical protein
VTSTRDDEIEGANDVVILSHSLWMRRFQGDPAAVGRTVACSGRPVPHRGRAAEGPPARRRNVPDLWARRAGRRLVAARGATRREAPPALLALLQRGGASAARRQPGRRGRRPAPDGRERRLAIPEPPSPWKPRLVPLRTRSSAPRRSTLGSWPARRWPC